MTGHPRRWIPRAEARLIFATCFDPIGSAQMLAGHWAEALGADDNGFHSPKPFHNEYATERNKQFRYRTRPRAGWGAVALKCGVSNPLLTEAHSLAGGPSPPCLHCLVWMHSRIVALTRKPLPTALPLLSELRTGAPGSPLVRSKFESSIALWLETPALVPMGAGEPRVLVSLAACHRSPEPVCFKPFTIREPLARSYGNPRLRILAQRRFFINKYVTSLGT